MKILGLGASGMLGNAMVRVLSEHEDWEVFGTVRSGGAAWFFSPKIGERLVVGVDVNNHDTMFRLFARVKPSRGCIRGLTLSWIYQ